MLMNGLAVSGAGNPGTALESQQFARRAHMPNGTHVGVSGPQNPGMAGFAGANPHMRMHPQVQHVRVPVELS